MPFFAGQPVYLQAMLPDGSWGGEAFGFANNSLNATNRINPGDMRQIFVEDLLAELDQAEEYWVDSRQTKTEESSTLYLAYNGTGERNAPPFAVCI
jgi:hypothetical protein